MSSHGLRVIWRAEAQSSARSRQIEKQLKRFPPQVNRAVRILAARHSRLADLALSFPGLAVTLAYPRRAFCAGPAIAAAIAGWPLAELARAARVPLWARHLPPECFAGPVEYLPESPDFFRRIANHLPQKKTAPDWLQAVAFAAHWGGEAYGVWMARVHGTVRKVLPHRPALRHQAMALWAFYSTRPDSFAHSLIERPWTPAIGLKAAVHAARDWWASAECHLWMGDMLVGDSWLMPGTVDGFSFEPLLSAHEMVAEAQAMQNCLRSFGYDVSRNEARIWGIRKDGRRVATMEVQYQWPEPMINIGQLHAARNRPAPPQVWWAAQQWLHRHDLDGLAKRIVRAAPPADGATWRKLWKPFWLAHRRVPGWLPLAPSENALYAL